jgi:hypothetical protein
MNKKLNVNFAFKKPPEIENKRYYYAIKIRKNKK